MCAASCLLPAPTTVPGMWQALKKKLLGIQGTNVGCRSIKTATHTDYLVQERTESEVINKQSCSPGQGTKGPGAYWFPPHKAKLKEETSTGSNSEKYLGSSWRTQEKNSCLLSNIHKMKAEGHLRWVSKEVWKGRKNISKLLSCR